MKAILVIISMLVIGMFAGVLVMADDHELDTSDDVETDLGSDEIEKALKEATGDNDEDSDGRKHRRVGFANIFRGFGSIDNDKSGYLMTGFWVTQKFSVVDSENKKVDSKERTHGLIKILGVGNYIIVKDTEASSETNLEFIVTKSRKHLNKDEAEDSSIGTLSLSKSEEFKGLTRWTGSLVMDSGDASGKWNVELSTDKKTLRKKSGGFASDKTIESVGGALENAERKKSGGFASDRAIESVGEALENAENQGERKGFWRRFGNFFTGRRN